jgi:hypothetical protein
MIPTFYFTYGCKASTLYTTNIGNLLLRILILIVTKATLEFIALRYIANFLSMLIEKIYQNRQGKMRKELYSQQDLHLTKPLLTRLHDE